MDDYALCDIKFEETGDQIVHSNNYLEEENGDTKPFPEEIINDLNEHKNIENDYVLTKINNSKKLRENLSFRERKNQTF